MTVQADSTTLQSPEWFLIGNRDKLSIKINGAITIGENVRGELALESRRAAEQLLTITIDAQDCLVVTYLIEGWQLSVAGEWVATSAGALLPRGCLIKLPHNEVFISHNIQRGKVEQTVVLEKIGAGTVDEDPPPTLDIVVPATMADLDDVQDSETPEVEASGNQSSPEVPDGFEPYVDEVIVLESEPAQVEPVISEPQDREQQTEPADKQVLKKPSRLPVIGAVVSLLVVLGLIAFIVYQQLETAQPDSAETPLLTEAPAPDTQGEAAEAPPVVPTSVSTEPVEPMDEVQNSDAIATVQTPLSDQTEQNTTAASALDQPAADAVALTEEVLAPVPEPGVFVQVGESTAEPAATDTQIDIEAELTRARVLIEGGYITWPAENAAQVLGSLLVAHPGHPEALEMLDEAAAISLIAAQRAYADGFRTAALLQVEQVRKFHPNYQPALDLERRWATQIVPIEPQD